MKQTNLAIGAVIFLSVVLSGCAASSIPPDKQKDYALLVPAEQEGHPDIIQVDQAIFHRSLLGSPRDVLPGAHTVTMETCFDNKANLLAPNCAIRKFDLDTKPGLAYVFRNGYTIDVYDRFDTKKKIDTLNRSSKTDTFIPQAEALVDNAEAGKKFQADREAAQAKLIEDRKSKLPLVRKIGARVCKPADYKTGFNTVVGFVEALADEKVQIRITDSYYRDNPNHKTPGFAPSITWDDPLNWNLCEK